MVRASRKVTGIVARYSDAISRRGIRPEAIYLFGSRARGRAGADSDIDLVVVSRAFRRMGYLRSLALLGEAAAEILEPIQALPYTPSEFASPLRGGFLEAIRPTCVPVLPPMARR
ncbi:MAG TPA: nucleotidyltransferase domain-containing protein [Planctomycetota bacterium]|nr:nucleotidyltransferase domain-containing protein [Planctomycetota bacterium]HRR81361.1 nucleotidyltransferase domain-containing protein [Planctomycetota bacterium]HRT94257.1 nucleotidyltransferase domain-containing protein [Planctomycetota bacterium]